MTSSLCRGRRLWLTCNLTACGTRDIMRMTKTSMFISPAMQLIFIIKPRCVPRYMAVVKRYNSSALPLHVAVLDIDWHIETTSTTCDGYGG